ncbi:hypothetical protein NP233_g10671 [Leucocoprinus birnbaumii]|uniref:Uncharacterized protein n=1 Tax=Leucocoprinus birnbaumii TaxID=56174 RepID=A0AAD5VHY3_9AGAR|nr:hypothetical protein NP233_g10671 [Leucocoprinus birnbaumii]
MIWRPRRIGRGQLPNALLSTSKLGKALSEEYWSSQVEIKKEAAASTKLHTLRNYLTDNGISVNGDGHQLCTGLEKDEGCKAR